MLELRSGAWVVRPDTVSKPGACKRKQWLIFETIKPGTRQACNPVR